MNAGARGTSYRPDIDGQRVVATLMVVAYHIGLPGAGGMFVGLDAFFVISGYLIVGLLIREMDNTGSIDWWAFFARRVRRLVPAAVAMYVAVLAFSAWFLPPFGDQRSLAAATASAAAAGSNLFFWLQSPTGYFFPTMGADLVAHTWSLSVEEQLYFGLAGSLGILLMLTRGKRPPQGLLIGCTLVIIMTSLALALWWSTSHPAGVKYLPLTRAYEFGIGVLIALLVKPGFGLRGRNGLAAFGIAGYLYCIVAPLPIVGYPSVYALIPTLSTAALIMAGSGNGTKVSRALQWKPLSRPAVVTYGWYLWHWPVLVGATIVNLGPVTLAVRLGCVLVALAIATLSYFLLERKFYRPASPDRAEASAKRVVRAGLLALAVPVALSGLLAAHEPWRASQPASREAEAMMHDRAPLAPDCLETVVPAKACALTEFRESRPTVVLWGDSLAWQHHRAVVDEASAFDLNVVMWNAPHCPPFDGTLPGHLLKSLSEGSSAPFSWDATVTYCSRHNLSALQHIRELAASGQGLRLILGARWSYYLGATPIRLGDKNAPSGYKAATGVYGRLVTAYLPSVVTEMAKKGVGIDFVAPMPEMERAVPMCLTRAWPRFNCNVSRKVFDRYKAVGLSWLKSTLTEATSDSRIVDMTNAICDESWCYASHGNSANFFDDVHITASLSLRVRSYFLRTMERAAAAARPEMSPR